MKHITAMAAVSTMALALAACGDDAAQSAADSGAADQAAAQSQVQARSQQAQSQVPSQAQAVALFDGQTLDGWRHISEGEWTVEDGEIVGTSNLPTNVIATERDYRDFVLTLEFWISEGGNSGVFFRCAEPEPTDLTCYEANIFDRRPDQSGRTGSLVNIAPPQVVIDTEERWNTYEIRAQGDHLVVILNGQTTVDIRDTTHTMDSPIFLQAGPGVARFRNIEITEN